MRKRHLMTMMLILLLAAPVAGCSSSAPEGGTQQHAEEQEPENGEGQQEEGEEDGEKEAGEKDASVLSSVMSASPEEYLKIQDPAALMISTAAKRTVSDEEVEEEFGYYRDNATFLRVVEDRDTAQQGDVVNIDYTETTGGEEGPRASGFNYEIGGNMFSSSFDEQLVGMKTGETKTVSFTYPDDYYAENLRGQEVSYEVTLNHILAYDTPEFNDETIARFGLVMDDGTAVNSEETLREYIRARIEKGYEDDYNYSRRSKAIMALTDTAEQIKDYPDEMINEATDFLTGSIGMADEDMDESTRASFRSYAEGMIKETMCVNYIADSRKISVSDGDIIEYLKEIYGSEAEDIFDQADERTVFSYRSSLRRERVADYILSVADVEETEGE